MTQLANPEAGPARRYEPPQLCKHPNPVVVVEDDDDIRDTFRDVLEDEGYRVYTACNGVEALAILHDLHGGPCLVLLDLMMPIMNGWQFLLALRKDPELLQVPVVILSAAPEENPAAVRVMGKPIDVDTLLDTVRTFCS